LAVLGIGTTMWAEELAFPSFDLRIDEIADHVVKILYRDARELRGARAHVLLDPVLVDR